jgi:hypothetical protein
MSRVAKNPETSSQARDVAADARFPVWMGKGGIFAWDAAAMDIATWTVRLIQGEQ